MIDRILAIEKAVREGLIMKEESQIHSRLSSLTPIKKPSSSSRPISSVKKPSQLLSPQDDDESLLHQLRREEFEREHQGKDYYHDEQGQYNLSLDDQSTFSTLASPTFNYSQHSISLSIASPTKPNHTTFSPVKSNHTAFSSTKPQHSSILSPTKPHSSFLSPTKQQHSFTSPHHHRLTQPMAPPSSRLSINQSMNDSSETSFLGDLPHFCKFSLHFFIHSISTEEANAKKNVYCNEYSFLSFPYS